MRHHLKKQHECSYLLLFSFQSNNLFSSGEIFTAANVRLLCHVFVIHRGRLPRSIGLQNPPPPRRKLFRVQRVYSSIGRKMRVSVLSPKPCTCFTPSLFENLSSSPSLASYVHPLTLTLIQAISSIRPFGE